MSYQVRRGLYDAGVLPSYGLDLPIISVGNLVFGGSGKTPLVVWLSQLFDQHEIIPVVATRGYKGDAEHGHALIEAQKVFRFNADFLGDEALLLAKHLKRGAVVVGKNRYENLKYYLPRINPHLILLDDGFQHLRIKRDFDIVAFDVTRPINSLRTAPLGYLREGLSSLRRADAIILNRVDQVGEAKLQEMIKFLRPHTRADCSWAHCHYTPVRLRDIFFNPAEDYSELKSRPVIAIAALANPNAFFQTLKDCGANIQDLAVYPDHHYFTKEEIAPLLHKCQESGAWLVASEKDLVKLRGITDSSLVRGLEISVKFTQGEGELVHRLLELVKRRAF